MKRLRLLVSLGVLVITLAGASASAVPDTEDPLANDSIPGIETASE